MTCGDWRGGHDFGTTVYAGKWCKCRTLVVMEHIPEYGEVMFRVKEAE